MRSSVAGIGLVVASGALLRFWSLGRAGAGDEERAAAEVVLRMMRTGDLNPHTFADPGLHVYLQLLVACVRFLLGAARGAWSSLEQFGPADAIVWGRALTAAFGTATVFLLYHIGMRWGSRHALLGAGLLAVLPFAVRDAHLMLPDVPATFFLTLAFLLALRAHEHGTRASLAWAGVAAGLAAACKYGAAGAILLPLLAAWVTPVDRAPRLARVAIVAGGFAGAFLLGAPYTLLDLPGFLEGYAAAAAARASAPGPAGGAWISALAHLRVTLQWPALLLALAGLVLGIVRAVTGPGHVRWMFLVSCPVVFVWTGAGGEESGRALLPVLPFASVLAAIAVISGVSLLRRFNIPRAPRTALIAGLTIAALLPPTVVSVRLLRSLGGPVAAHNAPH